MRPISEIPVHSKPCNLNSNVPDVTDFVLSIDLGILYRQCHFPENPRKTIVWTQVRAGNASFTQGIKPLSVPIDYSRNKGRSAARERTVVLSLRYADRYLDTLEIA